MAKKGTFTKILAIAGTVLVWLPILAPILFTVFRLIRGGSFLFDFLMPAEFFPLALAGGLLLLWASLQARSHLRLIGWSFVAALTLLVGGQVLAVITGLASGNISPGGWESTVVYGSILLYILLLILIGIGGIRLVKYLFIN